MSTVRAIHGSGAPNAIVLAPEPIENRIASPVP
jgi:hypothetical protein